MPVSECYLFKNVIEFRPAEEINLLRARVRRIYVLFKASKRNKDSQSDPYMNVVYIGVATAGRRSGIAGRLIDHFKKKKGQWTHFSAFEVWDNVTEQQIKELEGLFQHVFRRDAQANRLAKQKRYGPLKRITSKTPLDERWKKVVTDRQTKKI